MKQSDIVSALSLLAGVCGILGALIISTVTSVQMQIHPGQAVTIPSAYIVLSAIIGAVGTLSSGLVRIFTVKADAPATAIVAGAKVVSSDTTVVHEETPSIATNVVAAAPAPAQNGIVNP